MSKRSNIIGNNTNSSSGTVTKNGGGQVLSIHNNTLSYGSTGSYAIGITGSVMKQGSFIGYSQIINKKIYNILGENFEIEDNFFTVGNDVMIAIATLNTLGYKFYDELIKNGYSFPENIAKIIENKVKTIKRENNIDEIIK